MAKNPDAIYFQSKSFPSHEFLSNFYSAPIWIWGEAYLTTEHAYQAMKCVSPETREAIRKLPTPGMAKRAGAEVELRSDWESVKMGVMEEVLEAKFYQHPRLADMLLDTGDKELVEYAPWGDVFWGVNKDYDGENHLGKLLMKLRKRLHGERLLVAASRRD